jgi:NAD(P)H-hydrate epimerase
MRILTGDQMRAADRHAIERLGIPGILLMEQAGRAVADALLEDRPDAGRTGVAILCGRGNNGGDGFVIARRLRERGIEAAVVAFAAAGELRGDAATAHETAVESGVRVVEAIDRAAWDRERDRVLSRGIVVDAMLGTGVSGGARGLVADVIADLARTRAFVVSVDLPSGVDANAGEVAGPAVRADVTYTLCRPKLALLLEPAASLAGRWRVLDIGIPEEAVEAAGSNLEWLDAAAVAPLLPARPKDAHKGRFGHLLVVAGSRGKSGAAVLCARGALRAGAGLVTVATSRDAQPLVAVQQAEVMTEIAASAAVALRSLASRDALAIGPGLGTSAAARALVTTMLAKRRVPAVADADALNVFEGRRLRAGKLPLVITPHPGEAARLLGTTTPAVQADRLGSARRLADATGAVVVLKGHHTVVAEPGGAAAFNSTGNPGMATAGMGDVLTGIVGAFLARGIPARDAARLAAYVHGDAGDRAAASRGQEGLIATDAVGALPAALSALRGSGGGG